MKQALSHYMYVGASCVAMMSFLVVFVGTLIWVYRKDAQKIYQYVSNLPLEDE